ncbi:eukaryotic translation initiation factor 6-like protein [Leptotrombidium deliense]|uniref:Eukaryotic translation initiation factor 6 n=1 Tax=Leptotrombidium deliense TaxID=299467 RepID=A0A443S7C7_9ACAR|nr:eukaryotic translation initiation factor 6-like protein [Leptotrombidium deliense]
MALRVQFEGNDEIGAFTRLTNSYCLLGISANSNYFSVFESELSEVIPVVNASIGGTRIIGRLCVGNRHGLLVPSMTTDEELQHIRNSLPDTIQIRRIEEKFSALGNIIACNDYIALIHPDIDEESKEIIGDVLNVEPFAHSIGTHLLVGSYSAFNNKGGIVSPNVKVEEIDQLSTLLQIPLIASTVNRGSHLVGSGLVVNDYIAFCGYDTTATEINLLENIYQLKSGETVMKRENLIEALL